MRNVLAGLLVVGSVLGAVQGMEASDEHRFTAKVAGKVNPHGPILQLVGEAQNPQRPVLELVGEAQNPQRPLLQLAGEAQNPQRPLLQFAGDVQGPRQSLELSHTTSFAFA